MNVLIGVDGSKRSADAVSFVAQMLNPSKDRVFFFYHPQEVHIEREYVLSSGVSEDVRQRLVDDVFSQATQALPMEFRGPLQTIVGEKDPAKGLLIAADQIGANLIVVGADSSHRSLNPFLGRVARKVSRRAKVPVLVYRTANEKANPDGPLSVILAHDGSNAATVAGKGLDKFTWPHDTEAAVVRVLEWIDVRTNVGIEYARMGIPDYENVVEKAVTNTRKHLVEITDSLPEVFRKQEPVVKDGGSVEDLCNLVRERSADLIVVGPHNRGLVEMIVGGTTDALLHYAPCSVLVHHEPESP